MSIPPCPAYLQNECLFCNKLGIDSGDSGDSGDSCDEADDKSQDLRLTIVDGNHGYLCCNDHQSHCVLYTMIYYDLTRLVPINKFLEKFELPDMVVVERSDGTFPIGEIRKKSQLKDNFIRYSKSKKSWVIPVSIDKHHTEIPLTSLIRSRVDKETIDEMTSCLDWGF